MELVKITVVVCDEDPLNDCVEDCLSDFGGPHAVLDECGTCDNDPSNDCMQIVLVSLVEMLY